MDCAQQHVPGRSSRTRPVPPALATVVRCHRVQLFGNWTRSLSPRPLRLKMGSPDAFENYFDTKSSRHSGNNATWLLSSPSTNGPSAASACRDGITLRSKPSTSQRVFTQPQSPADFLLAVRIDRLVGCYLRSEATVTGIVTETSAETDAPARSLPHYLQTNVFGPVS